MKVCAYVMTYDSGLAPNPFHGFCTLAVCTPNHVNAKLGNGDYIIGVAGVDLCKKLSPPSIPYKLIYAMKIDKCLTLDEYYKSTDFKSKIPKRSGSKEEMCGDNFYKLSNGELKHTGESTDHDWKDIMEQDCKGNRVFIGKTFNYFGSVAPKIPSDSQWGSKLINQFKIRSTHVTYFIGGRCRYQWTPNDFDEFLKFLDENRVDHIPNPIDFDNWQSDPDKKLSCSGCS